MFKKNVMKGKKKSAAKAGKLFKLSWATDLLVPTNTKVKYNMYFY